MARLPVALRSNRGQALIETLALSSTLIAALGVLFGVAYFGFVHIGANYLMHELLVCQSTDGEHGCNKKFHARAESFLFAAKVLDLESRRGLGAYRVRLVLRMPLGRTLTLKKELRI
jgi:hypothetical protein